jgi:hypothetical protein
MTTIGGVTTTDRMAMAERLRAAFDLFELGVSIMRTRLRREHPGATDAEIEAMVRQWLSTRPGAEHGDAVGRPITLDNRTT